MTKTVILYPACLIPAGQFKPECQARMWMDLMLRLSEHAVIDRRSQTVFAYPIKRGMVGTARFELATYGTQNRRATRLRYAPMSLSLAPLVGIEKRDFADHSSHGQVAVV